VDTGYRPRSAGAGNAGPPVPDWCMLCAHAYRLTPGDPCPEGRPDMVGQRGVARGQGKVVDDRGNMRES